MIRLLSLAISAPVALFLLTLIGLYASYGEVEPCRVLAVERARRATVSVPGIEAWTRIETSQMSTGDCTSGLLDSWGERLSGLLH